MVEPLFTDSKREHKLVMDERGVYAVARSIWTDPDFPPEPFTKREAWLWLLGRAAWQSCRVRGNTGKPVDLDRAEFSVAVDYMATAWRWNSKSTVARFLKSLIERDMLRDASRNGFQIYSINKYNDFQVVALPARNANRNDNGTAAARERNKEEAFKHSNIESSNLSQPPKTETPAYPVWLPAEPWQQFIAMRKKDKGFSPHAEKLLLRRLEQLANKGHDPTAVIEQSIMNTYKGLFPLKAENNGRTYNAKSGTSADQHISGIADLAAEIRAGRA